MHIISLHAYHIITCKKEKNALNLGPFNILDFPGVWEYRSNIFFALFLLPFGSPYIFTKLWGFL